MAAIPIPGVNTPTYQTWGAAVANELNRSRVLRWATVSVTLSAEGYATITPATFGLTAVIGGIMSPKYPYDANLDITVMSCYSDGTNLVGRIFGLNHATNDIILAQGTFQFHAVAWGTAP